jgi:hypothetical protein
VTGPRAVRRSPRLGGATLVVALAIGAGGVGCKGCGKKEVPEDVPPPPPVGAASLTELTTQLGPARGLEESLAPTSTKWKRVFVLDDKRVVLAGETVSETVAVISDDEGKSWRSLHMGREGWANWNLGMDGSIVLAVGQRAGAKGSDEGALDATKLAFAAADATTLGPFLPLFPPAKGQLHGKLPTESAIPAFVAPEYAVLVAEENKKQELLFGGRPGVDAILPVKAPAGEKLVPVPFGRPPSLVSIKGKSAFVRAMSAPGKPFERPTLIPKLVVTPTLLAELSAAPACDFGAWTFQIVKQADGPAVVGVSPGKVVLIPLPPSTKDKTSLGCNGERVVVEAVDGNNRGVLVSCDFKGDCIEPKNAPFRPWPEKHDMRVKAVPTEKGILAVLEERSGDRWGLYLAQSNDSAIFDQPRVIGEGTGDRGRIELGALLPFGERVLLLVTSDLTGTSRRGWYATATDDGGPNWHEP